MSIDGVNNPSIGSSGGQYDQRGTIRRGQSNQSWSGSGSFSESAPVMFGSQSSTNTSGLGGSSEGDVFISSSRLQDDGPAITSRDVVMAATPAAVTALQDPSFVEVWSRKILNWAPREVIEQYANAVKAADNAVAQTPFNVPIPNKVQSATRNWGNSATTSQVLGLGNQTVKWGELFTKTAAGQTKFNGQLYRQAVSSNFSQALKNTPKNPLRLWGDIMKGSTRNIGNSISSGKNLIGGALTGLGVGLMVFDVAKETAKTYRAAKAREDGTVASQLRTLGETAYTATVKTAKNSAGWATASIGFALGTALVPVPGLNIAAGLVLGTLASTLLGTAANALVPTRSKGTEAVRKAQQYHDMEQENAEVQQVIDERVFAEDTDNTLSNQASTA